MSAVMSAQPPTKKVSVRARSTRSPAELEEERKIRAELKAKARHWHHDIKFINGVVVETVVKQYQETKDEDVLAQIVTNYSIFRGTWAKAFSQYLDNDMDNGSAMHDEIIWRAALKFDTSKSQKPNGRAFNAYLVSSLLNGLKNQRNARMSHKNHPRVTCPVCGELVYQIDGKHLRHLINLDRYKKMFHNYPISSLDGKTRCPMTGQRVDRIAMAYPPDYSIVEFMRDFHDLTPGGHLRCPVTGSRLDSVTADYPSKIMKGYTQDEFIRDFPQFPGIVNGKLSSEGPRGVRCPFSGEVVPEVTQEHLARVLGAVSRDPNARTIREMPNLTVEARQVDVVNPYTGETVPEITLDMLAAAGTTWKEHMERYAEIWLDKYYPGNVICPVTGRKTHTIKRSNLAAMGMTVQQYYQAVCKYPLRKWEVKCACCGEWVSNIWTHLEKVGHSFPASLTVEEYERQFGSRPTKIMVRTNSYVENDVGDSIHVADLFPAKIRRVDLVELEDSLLHVSEDDLDRKIAAAVRLSHTVEDIFFSASDIRTLDIPFAFKAGMTKHVRDAARDALGSADFDLTKCPSDGESRVSVMIPSRDTIRKRLARMIECSDLL